MDVAEELNGPDVRDYRLTREDLIRGRRSLVIKGLTRPWTIIVLLGVFALIAGQDLAHGRWQAATLFALIMPATWLIVLFWQLPRQVDAFIARSPIQVAPARIAVRSDGLHYQSGGTTTRYDWTAFVNYRARPHIAYLYTASNQAVIILQSCLTDDDRRNLQLWAGGGRAKALAMAKKGEMATRPELEGLDARVFSLTARDRFATNITLWHNILRRPLVLTFAAVILILGAAPFLIIHDWGPLLSSWVFVAGAYLAVVYGLNGVAVLAAVRDPRTRQPISLAVRSDGLHHYSGLGFVLYTWDRFEKYEPGRHRDLLYLSPGSALILSTPALTDEDRARMRELVPDRSKLKRKAIEAAAKFG